MSRFRKNLHGSPKRAKWRFPVIFTLASTPTVKKSPNPEDVPDLARQLSVAQRLVDHLLASRREVKEPFPTHCILSQLVIPGGAAAESPSPDGAAPRPPRQKSSEPTANRVREAYTLSLDCSPEVFSDFLTRLVSDPWIFVPMDIRVENEQASFPKREEFEKLLTTPAAASGNDVSGQATPSTAPLLLVLAGKERLRVRMSVDFVFLPPEKEAKPKEKGS